MIIGVEALLKSVEAEDEARSKLWDAQMHTRDIVHENLKDFVDAGIVKLEINRPQLRRMVGGPALPKHGGPDPKTSVKR